MKKVSTYIWEHKFAYLLAFLSLVISVALDMLSPQLTRRIVDDVILGGKTEILTPLLAGILLVGLGRCVFQYIKEFTCDTAGSKISADLRRDLFRHVQSLSAEFFDRTGTGELMSRVKDDVDRICGNADHGSGGTYLHRPLLHVQSELAAGNSPHGLHGHRRRHRHFYGKKAG